MVEHGRVDLAAVVQADSVAAHALAAVVVDSTVAAAATAVAVTGKTLLLRTERDGLRLVPFSLAPPAAPLSSSRHPTGEPLPGITFPTCTMEDKCLLCLCFSSIFARACEFRKN